VDPNGKSWKKIAPFVSLFGVEYNLYQFNMILNEADFYYKEGSRMMDDMGCYDLDLQDKHYEDKYRMCEDFRKDIINMIAETGIKSQTYLEAPSVLIK